jgi:hypothetical protein
MTGLLATPICVSGAGCKLYDYDIYNAAAAASYVSFYDTAIAPTVGTTVPKFQVGLATLTTKTLGAQDAGGIYFKDGLWVAATTTSSGSSAPASALAVSLGIS